MTDYQKTEFIKEKSARYFDHVAADGYAIPEPLRCYSSIIEKLAGFKSGYLADVGCGTGGMLRCLIDQMPGVFELYGCDISEKSLRRAAEDCPGAVHLVQADAEALPWQDGMFDVVLCMHSFHHYPRPEKALGEILRVLRSGGRLLLVENDYPSPRRQWINLRLKFTRYFSGDLHMYSGKELQDLAAGAGFTCGTPDRIGDHSQLLECIKP